MGGDAPRTTKRWRLAVFYRTRDPAFLWGVVLAFVAIGLIGGAIAGRYAQGTAPTPRVLMAPALPDALEDLLSSTDDMATHIASGLADNAETTLAEWLSFLDVYYDLLGKATRQEIGRLIALAVWPDEMQQVAAAHHASLEAGRPDPRLLALAAAEPPVPGANLALGALWQYLGEIDPAIAALKAEDSDDARVRLVAMLLHLRRLEELQDLSTDPRYAPHFDDHTQLEIARMRGDWLTVARHTIPAIFERLEPITTSLAAVSGAAWLAFLLHAGLVWESRTRVILCLLAIPAGVLSVGVTHFAITWQEEALGLHETDELAGGLLFYVAGVGLREELAKLLCFTPFLPLLLRRDSELEALIVAGCVGLGFAAFENTLYYQMGGDAAPTRFVTANFFHIALTGLCGLALYRLLVHRGAAVEHFVTVLVGAILVHGLYDAFLSLPALAQDYDIAAMILLLLASWQFLRELRDTRGPSRDTVSLAATFLFGGSLLAALSLIYVSWQVGLRSAIGIVIPAMASVGLIAYALIREMPGMTHTRT